ncbi:MAG TPA: hypothetical protein VNE42_00915, partial [Acidimicrobiales bacterium]|nr:hypothetical protein [Acidimicrobiales bacterium]
MSRDDSSGRVVLTNIDIQDDDRLDAARYVGARTRRKEDPRLLSGQGSYVDDVVLPGMGHVAFVRSPYPRATIDAIDVSAAKGLPGVLGVLTGRDLTDDTDPPGNWRKAILPIEHVVYVGEPVVMVIAESRALAEDAAELVEVSYTREAPVIELEDAIADLHLAHHGDETNVFESVANASFERVDEILARSPHVFTE